MAAGRHILIKKTSDIKYIDNSQEESATDKEEASEQDSPAADTSEEIAKTSDATGIMGYIGMLLVSLGIFAVALNTPETRTLRQRLLQRNFSKCSLICV